MEGPLETRLARFQFKYRVTPQAVTGIAPAELLMDRRLCTHLDVIPDCQRQGAKEPTHDIREVVVIGRISTRWEIA